MASVLRRAVFLPPAYRLKWCAKQVGSRRPAAIPRLMQPPPAATGAATAACLATTGLVSSIVTSYGALW